MFTFHNENAFHKTSKISRNKMKSKIKNRKNTRAEPTTTIIMILMITTKWATIEGTLASAAEKHHNRKRKSYHVAELPEAGQPPSRNAIRQRSRS